MNPPFTVDCAAAADGGSLLLQFLTGDCTESYVLDRSFASRGTPQYDRISGAHGPLSDAERTALLARIEGIVEGPCVAIAKEFAQVLAKPPAGR